MTETTQAIRDQAFLPLSSDIPEGVTLGQYRLQRRRRHRSRQRSLRYARRPWLSFPRSYLRDSSPTF
jgi:hypothetical protein